MNVKTWFLVQKWTSLICTLFLLMLCLIGLPLIFHEEIDHLFGDEIEAPVLPTNTPDASLDKLVDAALNHRPNDVIRFMSRDEHHPHLAFASMASSTDAPGEENSSLVIDTRTAAILDEPTPDRGFMYVMFKLHVDLFAGLPGMLFLSLMGLLFVVAIVSSVVLYAPFMRKLDFGTVRSQRSPRLKWLDLHNLLGVVTLLWAFVVGLTGSINTLSPIVAGSWQQDQLASMTPAYAERPLPEQLGSLQRAVDTADAAVDNMQMSFIAWPGSQFSSQHHYAVFYRGDQPLTSRMLQPVLVDAQSGELLPP